MSKDMAENNARLGDNYHKSTGYEESKDRMKDGGLLPSNLQTEANLGRSKEAIFDENGSVIECAVCLQPCIHPVQLECKHIFCFLCVKGAAHRSKRCALCRQEISPEYFANPKLVRQEDLQMTVKFDNQYQWFYQGGNGWWQYDDRTSQELESRHKKGDKVFELLIAGFLYIIDLENMFQVRRNDRSRKRKVRRDLVSLPGVKGVAGLKYSSKSPLTDRPVGDGNEEEDQSSQNMSNPVQNQTNSLHPSLPHPSLPHASPPHASPPHASPPHPSLPHASSPHASPPHASDNGLDDHSAMPYTPNNLSQTPNTPVDSPPNSLHSSQDLSVQFQNINLNDINSNQHPPIGNTNRPGVPNEYVHVGNENTLQDVHVSSATDSALYDTQENGQIQNGSDDL